MSFFTGAIIFFRIHVTFSRYAGVSRLFLPSAWSHLATEFQQCLIREIQIFIRPFKEDMSSNPAAGKGFIPAKYELK